MWHPHTPIGRNAVWHLKFSADQKILLKHWLI
jgi:hypothetical protein